MRIWTIRIVAVVGLAITAYLAVESLGASSLIGCGSGSGCDVVLASRWSHWLGLPVAFVGLALWLIILVSAFIKKMEPVLVSAALLAGGAAVWFVLLQVVRIGSLCPYCLAAHACALVLVGLVWPSREAFTRTGTVGATLGLAVLIGGQVFISSSNTGLMAYRADDAKIAGAPVVGDPHAEHVLVLYFDYTCPHCRRMHHYLDQAQTRYGNQIALALAPAPMDADCNPTYQRTPSLHKNACELASLALAVWNARQDQFAKMNAFLFNGKDPPSVKSARDFAEKLVGEDRLNRALNAPFIDAFLKAKIMENIRIGKRQGVGGLVPKVVSSDGLVLIGRARDANQLFDTLETDLGVKPIKSGDTKNRGGH